MTSTSRQVIHAKVYKHKEYDHLVLLGWNSDGSFCKYGIMPTLSTLLHPYSSDYVYDVIIYADYEYSISYQ